MNRRSIWCFGLCLSGVIACERYPDGEENQKDRAESAAVAVPQEERVEELPAKSEEVGDVPVDAKTNAVQNQSLRLLKMMQNEVAALERDIRDVETKLTTAPSSEALQSELVSVQTLVRDAKNQVGALEDVRNLPNYEEELAIARDALRTARRAVDNFRTEIKKTLEANGSSLPEKRKTGQTTP